MNKEQYLEQLSKAGGRYQLVETYRNQERRSIGIYIVYVTGRPPQLIAIRDLILDGLDVFFGADSIKIKDDFARLGLGADEGEG